MKKFRNITTVILMISTIMLAAAAGAYITVTPLSQDIPIGTTGTYAVNLDTLAAGNLNWDTGTSVVTAHLDSASDSQTGNIVVSSGASSHTLYVTPQSGAVAGASYDITIWNTQGTQTIKALATAGVVPTPELSTGILLSVGLIGLFGIVRMNRK